MLVRCITCEIQLAAMILFYPVCLFLYVCVHEVQASRKHEHTYISRAHTRTPRDMVDTRGIPDHHPPNDSKIVSDGGRR